MDQFKERLSIAMSRAAKNQRELAQELGVSAAAVSKWCQGKPPSTKHLGRLAGVLGVDVDYLMLGEGSIGRNLDSERALYQDRIRWHFRPEPADGGRDYGDAAGFAFKPGLRTLARECGQNTSDAKLDTEPTAVLEFTVIEVTGESLEAFKRAICWDTLHQHLVAASKHVDRAQSAQSIRPAVDMINSGRLHLLRVADYGTTGLTGEEFGASKFVAVMRNTLDSDKGETAGGSYGLGKATMTAASRIGLVVSASNLAEPYERKRMGRTIARIELPWHRIEGESRGCAGPGWLGDWDDDRGCTVSYWDNEALLHDLFLERPSSSTGTSFLVVAAFDNSGLAETIEEMAREIELGAAYSFWPAMASTEDGVPRLQVRVRAMHNRDVVLDTNVDPTAHVPAQVEMLTRYSVNDTVANLEKSDDVALRHVLLNVPARTLEPKPHGPTEHDAVLLVALANEIDDHVDALNTVAFMRGSRMVVKETPVRGLPVGAPPFRALVLAGEASSEDQDAVIAERFLRAAEPPEHNNWTVTRKVTDAYPRGARTALDGFLRAVHAEIRAIISAPTEVHSDGPDSLSELLRLKPAPGHREKQPRVKTASGTVRADGSWHVSATIALPRRDDEKVWVFDPVVRFASESGPPVTVQWRDLRAVERCTAVSTRSVKGNRMARTVRIEGETVPDSQPVSAKFSTIQIDVAKPRGEEAR
ncbi:helix-turn-helix domain-containing protein [Rhodococcus ruber]